MVVRLVNGAHVSEAGAKWAGSEDPRRLFELLGRACQTRAMTPKIGNKTWL
jgi:hypothetical protein